MEQLCHTLFTMTLAASVAAGAVMVLRLGLKRAPKSLLCALWLVVLLRMVCPVSFSLPVSLMPQPVTTGQVAQRVLPVERVETPAASVTQGATTETVTTAVMETETVMPTTPVETTPTISRDAILCTVWAAGAAGMLLWAGISYGKLRRRVSDGVLAEENVYESDQIAAPFVCGFVRPKIYLPNRLTGDDRRYVILHERAHIARKDYLTKPLAWLALSVHWFNPVLWLAYWLFGRDVEAACDQRVIKSFDRADTAGYAAALFHLGRRNSLPQAVPLAFGEEDAKGRIKHVLNYRKPGFWVVIMAAGVCVVSAALLLADPVGTVETDMILDNSPIEYALFTEWTYSVPEGDATDSYSRTVSLPEDLTRELVSVLQTHPHEAFLDSQQAWRLPELAASQEAAFSTEPYIRSLTVRGDRISCRLSIYENGTGCWENEVTGQVAVIPGLTKTREFQRWQKHLQTWLETGRADDLYALSQADLSQRGYLESLLYATGIREVFPVKWVDITRQDGTLTVQMKGEKTDPDFNDEEVFSAVFDQYLQRASLLTIALVDGLDTVAYVYADGTAGPTVTMEGEKPTQKEFRDLYQNGFHKMNPLVYIPGDTPSPWQATWNRKLDGTPIDSLSVDEPLLMIQGPGGTMNGGYGWSASVPLPNELVTELVTVLQNHPHKNYHLIQTTQEEFQAYHGMLVEVVEGIYNVTLVGNDMSRYLHLSLYEDGTASLAKWGMTAETGQRALIPHLADAKDFRQWKAHAEQWLEEGRADGIYARCTDPELSIFKAEVRVKRILEYTGLGKVFDDDSMDLSLEGGTLRLTMKEGWTDFNQPDMFQAALEQYLVDAAKMALFFLPEVDALAFVSADGVLYCEVKNDHRTLDQQRFRGMFTASYQKRVQQFKNISNTSA